LQLASDPANKSQVRFNAVKALETLSDPSKDVSLIMKWVSLAWRGLTAHCPSCHHSFPLWKVQNEVVSAYTDDLNEPVEPVEELLDRRLVLLGKADNRKKPHPGQIKAIAAPERHIVGTGAGRVGKSTLLAMLAFGALIIPGVEIWILARTYDDARKE